MAERPTADPSGVGGRRPSPPASRQPDQFPDKPEAAPPQPLDPARRARRRPFGRGRPVSLFTLGTMRALGDAAQMEAVLLAAVGVGINHLETAPAYGPAETFLGQALRRLERRDARARAGLVLTSKILPGLDGSRGRQALADCLRRLGVPHLDNLAVHGLNTADHLAWATAGPGAELLRWAVGEGLVGQVGFSSHGEYGLIAAALESGRFSFCSLHLHLFDPERLPLARAALAAGIGVMAISPADKGGRLHAPPPQLQEDCSPYAPLWLAYRVLLAEGISTLTLGASAPSDLDLARLLAAADGPLARSERQALERLSAAGRERLGTGWCGQCRRCLPCPNEVPIPALLRLRNLALGHDMEAFATERYNLIGRAGHWWEQRDASACGRCGACLPRCPLQLPIPDLLADTHRRLAGRPRRRLWD